MDKLRLWLGLVAFSAGLVLVLNMGRLLENTKLSVSIGLEIVVAVMIFGGLLLMYLAWDHAPSVEAKPKSSR